MKEYIVKRTVKEFYFVEARNKKEAEQIVLDGLGPYEVNVKSTKVTTITQNK